MQFKIKPAGPDIVKSKKRSSHPQNILYTNITFTLRICLRGGGGPGGDVKTIKTKSRNSKTTKVKIAETLRIKLKMIQFYLKLCTAVQGDATK